MSADNLSAAGVVEAFGEQWRASDLPAVMPEPGLIGNRDTSGGSEWVELTLIAVYDEHQHRGYASRAMRILTSLCHANAMTIKLVVRQVLETELAPGCPATLVI